MAKNVRRSRGIAVGAACTWRAGVDGLDLPLVPARPIRTGCGFRADLVRSPCMRGTLATLAFGVGAGGVAGLSRLVVPGVGRGRFVLPAGRHVQCPFLRTP